MAGWERKTLGEVVQLEYGKPLAPSDRNPTGRYPAYGANGEKDRTDKFYRDQPSIIVGRKGSAGEVTLTEERYWPLDVTYFAEFDRKRYDLKFLYYLLTTLDLPRLARGVKPGINRNEVYAVPVMVPLLPEQRRIVAILDEAFEGIATAEANAEKNLQSARELFARQRDASFAEGRQSWPTKPLGDVAEVQSGGTPLVSTKEFWGGDIAWYSSGELNSIKTGEPERLITDAGLAGSNAKLFPTGSLLLGMYDTAALKMSILDRAAAFNQAIAGVKPNPRLETEFLFHAINFQKPALLSLRRGVRQKNLSLGKIKEIVVPVPSPQVQHNLVERLRAAQKLSDRLQTVYRRKLVALDELKKSFLHEAFIGRLSSAKQVSVAGQPPLPTATPEFAANVVALAHFRHERQRRENTFGRVKEQKALHLVEAVARIDLGRQPIKDAAGPNDFRHMLKAEEWAKSHNFFEMVKRGEGYEFRKLRAFDERLASARSALGPYLQQLESVIDLLVPMDTEQAEVFATVLAAWNNLLIDGAEVTDAAIVSAAREGWHTEKLRIAEHKFGSAIELIRKMRLVPDGTAKYVGGQRSLL
jgi:restriction endonuclease S subunit